MASRTTQRAKFKAAAKSCKGKKIQAFRSCMRAKLKKQYYNHILAQ